MEKADKPVYGLALCLSKERTWCGDKDFQRCVSGSSCSSLGKYLSWSFSRNQQNGSYCPWKLLSLAVLPVPVKGRTYPCLSCSCANHVEQNKKASLQASVAEQATGPGQYAPTEVAASGRKHDWLEISVLSCFLCKCGA